MSEEAEETPKKAGKGKGLILGIAVAIVMGGAGVAGGLFAAGAFGSHDEEEAVEEVDPKKPQLVLKGEDPVAIGEQFAAEAHGEHDDSSHSSIPGVKKKEAHKGVDLPRPADPSKYQATYFQMPAPYTSNVADTDSLVQVALAISTYYDARVIDAVKTHEMAIRSEILLMMAQEQELVLATPKGKEALQKKLTHIINEILKEKTGYSGVDNVYFTNFVIQ